MIIHFENKSIAPSDLKKWKNKDFFLSANELFAAKFIEDWYSGKQNFEFETSGSTGIPKKITIKRELLKISAENTLQHLQISKHGGNALICINTKFIGGAMMLVRALCNSMDIYFTPLTSNPIISLPEIEIELCSMVPAQLHEVLNNSSSTKNLKKIKNLLIGGGTIHPSILKRIPSGTNNIYHTYGMTETVSHVALKNLTRNGEKDYFIAVGDNKFSLNSQNQLIISGSITEHNDLLTNDVVELHEDCKFKWLGRADNVINSGGLKFYPEQIELRLQTTFHEAGISNRFFITGSSDEKFGEVITLFLEGPANKEKIKSLLKDNLSKYEIPKVIHFVNTFAETETGKINRKKTIDEI